MNYRYLFWPSGNRFIIVHVQSCYHIGYVDPHGAEYNVRDAEGVSTATVRSVSDALPVLLDHYEKHPPQWKRRGGTKYTKVSQFGLVEIEQDRSGCWLVYRPHNDDDDQPLLRDGKPALFAAAEEAQRAADAHVRDYPNADPTDDGLSWAVYAPMSGSCWTEGGANAAG
jgi:hypothetical protein